MQTRTRPSCSGSVAVGDGTQIEPVAARRSSDAVVEKLMRHEGPPLAPRNCSASTTSTVSWTDRYIGNWLVVANAGFAVPR